MKIKYPLRFSDIQRAFMTMYRRDKRIDEPHVVYFGSFPYFLVWIHITACMYPRLAQIGDSPLTGVIRQLDISCCSAVTDAG